MENPSIRPVHFFICPYGDGTNRKWHAFLLSDSKINSSVHFLQRRWEERKEVKREKNRSRGNKECSVKLKWAPLHSRVSAVIRRILVLACKSHIMFPSFVRKIKALCVATYIPAVLHFLSARHVIVWTVCEVAICHRHCEFLRQLCFHFLLPSGKFTRGCVRHVLAWGCLWNIHSFYRDYCAKIWYLQISYISNDYSLAG